MAIAYSTTRQPAKAIIAALGRSPLKRKVQVSTVNVVNQRGPNVAGTGIPKPPSVSEHHLETSDTAAILRGRRAAHCFPGRLTRSRPILWHRG
jgi:hypothetical protein